MADEWEHEVARQQYALPALYRAIGNAAQGSTATIALVIVLWMSDWPRQTVFWVSCFLALAVAVNWFVVLQLVRNLPGRKQ